MHSVRITNNRLPQVYQVCRAAPVSHNTTRNMSFFPRTFQHDLAPMFRLIDAFDAAITTPRGPATNNLRTFQPRFDVQEHADSYELQGELPGIESRDVEIEWTDSNVLSIKGRTESVKEQGSKPAAEAAIEARDGTQTPQSVDSDTGSYHKVSVEDEEEDATSSNAASVTSQQPEQQLQQQQQNVSSQVFDQEKPSVNSNTSQWWVSERSIGEFARSFSFPSRVDQDNVKASMDKGILRILVPKSQAPVKRRVEIQ